MARKTIIVRYPIRLHNAIGVIQGDIERWTGKEMSRSQVADIIAKRLEEDIRRNKRRLWFQ